MVSVKLNGKITKFLEEKNYTIPRIKNKKGRMVVSKSAVIEVNLLDLPLWSGATIKVRCDYCGEVNSKKYRDYHNLLTLSNIKRDCCKNCAHLKTSDGRFRYTYDDATKEFIKASMTILITESEYIDASSPIPYECQTCGNKSKVALSNILLGRTCKKCAQVKNAKEQRLTYELIKEIFEQANCTLLTKEYVNSGQILKYICNCGNIGESRIGCFKKGRRCRVCRYKKQAKLKQLIYRKLEKHSMMLAAN